MIRGGRVEPRYGHAHGPTAWLLVLLTALATSCGFCLWTWSGKVYVGSIGDDVARHAASDTDLPVEERRSALSEVFLRTEQNLEVLRACAEDGGLLAGDAHSWARKLLPILEQIATEEESPR